MKALKKVLELIHKKPHDPSTRTLTALVVALEADATFELGSLYKLPFDEFELALELLADWRLDRYYSSNIHLLDLSMPAGELVTAEA